MINNLGKRLRIVRERLGLLQHQLAKKSGLTEAAISHFETGRRIPSAKNLIKLAGSLGVSIDYLLGRVKKPV